MGVASSMLEAKQAIRERSIRIAKMNLHPHHLGQKNYEDSRAIWIQEGFYPTTSLTSSIGSSSSLTVEVNRGDDWFCAMHKKDKKTGARFIPNDQTKVVADKYLEFKEKVTQGTFVPERNKDALYMALGEKQDHVGRAYGFGGVNIGVRKAFGDPPPRISQSCQSTSALVNVEALETKIREQLRAEFNATMKDKVTSILQEMGITSNRLPGALIPPSITMPLPPQFKDDTKCTLFLMDPATGKFHEVAHASAWTSSEKDRCHGMTILEHHVRVRIDTVLDGFKSVDLPVPVSQFDILVLEHGLDSFVQWPQAWVRISHDVNHGMSPENFGSNDLPTGESVPRCPTLLESLHTPLSGECEWLRTFLESMRDDEHVLVPLNANLFHYIEDQMTRVSKIEIADLLAGKKLDISVIIVFMRALQDDLVSCESLSRIGWLCPNLTSDAIIKRNLTSVKDYIFNAFEASVKAENNFMLAPIFQDSSWMLLAICVPKATIYFFDSSHKHSGWVLKMKSIVNSQLKRYKLNGGHISRNMPLWKDVQCAQQMGAEECGFYIMRHMLDIVSNCISIDDLEKFYMTPREEPFTKDELDVVRNKWAKYFTDSCV